MPLPWQGAASRRAANFLRPNTAGPEAPPYLTNVDRINLKVSREAKDPALPPAPLVADGFATEAPFGGFRFAW